MIVIQDKYLLLKIMVWVLSVGREQSCKISEYRLQVIEHYAGDWQQFFIDFRNDTNNKFHEILTQNKML